MQTLVIKGVRGGEFPGEVNVTVAPSKNAKMLHGLFIASNFHYPVPGNDGEKARSELVTRYLQQEWKGAKVAE